MLELLQRPVSLGGETAPADREAAAIVAQQIAPPVAPSGRAVLCDRERDRPGPGGHHGAAASAERAGGLRDRVHRDDDLARADQRADVFRDLRRERLRVDRGQAEHHGIEDRRSREDRLDEPRDRVECWLDGTVDGIGQGCARPLVDAARTFVQRGARRASSTVDDELSSGVSPRRSPAHLAVPAVSPASSCRAKTRYRTKTGIIARVSAASTAFQSFTNWPRNCCAPRVTVFVRSPGARISGNHRSFQTGSIEKTATVPTAGRTSGSSSRNTRYSLAPSIRAASFNSLGTCSNIWRRMKMATGRPIAVYTRISATSEFVSPSCVISRSSDTVPRRIGIMMPMIRNRKMRPPPGS